MGAWIETADMVNIGNMVGSRPTWARGLKLNRAQQGNLASQLTSNISPTAGSPYVTGEVIYLGLRNYLRGHGYGDIVTTNR